MERDVRKEHLGRELRRRASERPLSRIVTGVAVLAAGIILWLDHLDRLNARDYLAWWPVVLFGYALANLVDKRWTSAIVLTVLGVAFLPHMPFLPNLRLSQLLAVWPLLISVAGLTLVMQALRPPAGSPVTFRTVAVMGGNQRVVGSSPAGEVPRGDVVAVMGGCEIDLTAVAPARQVLIDALVFWGGLEVKVPRGWAVETRMAMVLGAVVNNTMRTTDPNAPRVVIRGSVIMGGIDVKNPKEVIA